jgi:putative membrane protein
MFCGSMGGWMIFGWILIIVLIIAAVSFFVRQQGALNREKSAMDILKERYSRGEISKEEFEEKKRDIL